VRINGFPRNENYEMFLRGLALEIDETCGRQSCFARPEGQIRRRKQKICLHVLNLARPAIFSRGGLEIHVEQFI
jgi:hypothetical protein